MSLWSVNCCIPQVIIVLILCLDLCAIVSKEFSWFHFPIHFHTNLYPHLYHSDADQAVNKDDYKVHGDECGVSFPCELYECKKISHSRWLFICKRSQSWCTNSVPPILTCTCNQLERFISFVPNNIFIFGYISIMHITLVFPDEQSRSVMTNGLRHHTKRLLLFSFPGNLLYCSKEVVTSTMAIIIMDLAGWYTLITPCCKWTFFFLILHFMSYGIEARR